jgi:nucleoside-diphosphate kinase
VPERTLIIIKPDGVRRGLVGSILSRFENRGFLLVKLQFLSIDKEKAEAFYSPHREKPFFRELISFITSGPVVAIVLEGTKAVEVARRMVGSTNSVEASPGTVRGDLALGITENVIHASDSIESFERESRIIFD